MNPILEYRQNYEPRAQVSPSRFKLARMCARADAYRYVAGIREIEHKWEIIGSVPKPAATHDPKDKAAAKEHRARVAAWNRARRGPLGKECHKLIEAWYASFLSPDHPQLDQTIWHTEPGRIVLAGLHLLPHPSTLGWWATEQKIPDSFVSEMTGGVHDYEFNAYIDLLATLKIRGPHGFQLANDYKTTSSFDWMLKPAELIEDTQGVMYPLYAMRRSGVDSIVPRWTYFRTEDAPSARAVDFRVTYDGAKRRALKLFDEGATLVQRCVDRVDPADVPGNVALCHDFYHRTCVYHHAVGGPCNAESTPGKRLRASLATQTKREQIMAGFKKNGAAAKAAEQEQTGAAEDAQGGATEDATDGEGAVDTGAAGAAASGGGFKGGGARRGRPPKAAGAAGSAGAVTVATEHGAFDVPENSPMHEKLNAIGLALFGG